MFLNSYLAFSHSLPTKKSFKNPKTCVGFDATRREEDGMTDPGRAFCWQNGQKRE